MRFLIFDTLDSTNLECRRQLEGAAENQHQFSDNGVGKNHQLSPKDKDTDQLIAHQVQQPSPPPPLAVLCREQTHGRAQKVGGMRRKWVSPPGHLYLSVGVRAAVDPQLTLVCGSIVALFVHDVIGFAPTLKWPNDLLIDGRKLGGVLVETLMINQHSYQIIGVGLNVNMTSVVKGAAMLAQWSSQPLVIEDLARQLALRLCVLDHSEFHGAAWLRMRLAHGDYGLMSGLWMVGADKSPLEFVYEGIDQQGHLLATPLGGQGDDKHDRTQSFSSPVLAPQWPWGGGAALVDHKESQHLSVWLEVGHSRLKARLYPGLRPLVPCCDAQAWRIVDMYDAIHSRIRKPWLASLTSWLAVSTLKRPLYLADSGDRGVLQALKDALAAAGFRVVTIPKQTLRLKMDITVFLQIGFDRICIMEAALARCYRHGTKDWLMVVSFGTAVTVNCCDRDGEYLGGAILPAKQLAHQALTTQIASLAHLSHDNTEEDATQGIGALGMSTDQAVAVGLQAQQLGAVVYLYTQAIKTFQLQGRRPYHQVFVGGGGCQPYISRLRESLGAIYEISTAPAQAQATASTKSYLPFELVADRHHDVLDGLRILAVSAQDGGWNNSTEPQGGI